MIEYPEQDFEIREEEEGYNLGYEVSRLIRDYEVVSVIMSVSNYIYGDPTLAEMMYQLRFNTENVRDIENQYDEGLIGDDELLDARAEAIVEDGYKTQQRIVERLRELIVTGKQYPAHFQC